MVSALQSVRLLTSQYMLKAMKQVEQQQQQNAGGSSPQSALLSRYGIDTSSSSSSGSGSGALSTMLAALEAKYDTLAEAEPNTDTTETPAVSDDITTASFMKGLKAKLTDLKTQPGYAAQAEAMLAALKAGTLTVSDAVNGRQIKAWDVASDAEKTTVSKTGTTILNTGWSDFLKRHLTRGEDGTFARQADDSLLDKSTGEKAYFGTIGSDYVYLTWPKTAAKG